MSRRAGNPFAFGGRVPAAVGGLIAATVVASLVSVVGERNGLPLLRLAVLEPAAVWHGEVWRLVTWVLVETEPLNLLFGGLVLYWFGRDLVDAWGERRFLATYFGVAAAAGALACLLALAWPELAAGRFTGFWAALDALIVAWALLHPFRQILLFFAVPVSGQALLWITVGGTMLFALFGGVVLLRAPSPRRGRGVGLGERAGTGALAQAREAAATPQARALRGHPRRPGSGPALAQLTPLADRDLPDGGPVHPDARRVGPRVDGQDEEAHRGR